VTPGAPLDPYAPPAAGPPVPERGALDGDDLAGWRKRVRRGAALVVVSELARSILWRLGLAAATVFSLSADPAEHLEGGKVESLRAIGQSFALLVKLVGAIGVTTGVFLATSRPPRPLGTPAGFRLVTRGLAVVALAGHAVRWLLHIGPSHPPNGLEPATNLLDALAIAACTFAVAPLFRAAGRGGAVLAGLGLGYLALVVARVSFWGLGGYEVQAAWSITMLGVGVLATVLLLKLRRLLA
jgi:hypothetical protein